jgi:hypothetical protein
MAISPWLPEKAAPVILAVASVVTAVLVPGCRDKGDTGMAGRGGHGQGLQIALLIGTACRLIHRQYPVG